jgi:N-glycosylase/DNA lyase
MCESWGVPVAYDGATYYSFPTVERLSRLTDEDWAILHAGYRVPGLKDAAAKLSLPEFSASQLKSLPYSELFKKLQEIHGVGPKVAACVALFGLGCFEAFPIDVWIKRAMAELFPKGLPSNILPFAGIAQQYIFHYIRTSK